jgi:hypothetical protein
MLKQIFALFFSGEAATAKPPDEENLETTFTGINSQ